jgi:hypothetical protein
MTTMMEMLDRANGSAAEVQSKKFLTAKIAKKFVRRARRKTVSPVNCSFRISPP